MLLHDQPSCIQAVQSVMNLDLSPLGTWAEAVFAVAPAIDIDPRD